MHSSRGFKTLPIEFDAYGRAHLRDEEAEAPYLFADEARIRRSQNRERALEKLFDNPNVWNYSIDPVTRSSGNLVVNAVIDFEAGRVLDAQVENPQAYGAELILKNRRPSDAVQIAARIRGIERLPIRSRHRWLANGRRNNTAAAGDHFPQSGIVR
ncbi:MAG: hypothetical protein IPG76_11215 [Acidobacteria bacterium]|nr:hypothetical protein [Acidobacteriota bacterium]